MGDVSNELDNRAEWCITKPRFDVEWSYFELSYIKIEGTGVSLVYGKNKDLAFKRLRHLSKASSVTYVSCMSLNNSICRMGIIIVAPSEGFSFYKD